MHPSIGFSYNADGILFGLCVCRYLVEWWKEKEIDPEQKRLEGRCPLTPEETALVLKALDFDKETTIYIAAGTIYGGERRMAALRDVYPKTVCLISKILVNQLICYVIRKINNIHI